MLFVRCWSLGSIVATASILGDAFFPIQLLQLTVIRGGERVSSTGELGNDSDCGCPSRFVGP